MADNEQLSTKVISEKNKTRSKVTDAHLEGTLRLGSTHYTAWYSGVDEASPAPDRALNWK